MRNYIILAGLVLFVFGCNNNKTFKVEGNIAGADGKMLYLEAIELANVKMLDSVELSGSGDFKFKQLSALYPEFYRLRIGSNYINFSIDSTETVAFKVPSAALPVDYTVEGSDNAEKIRLISKWGQELKSRISGLETILKDSPDVYRRDVLAAVSEYKSKVSPLIYENPKSSAAYFALFQRINDLWIFDPFSKDDYKVFAAVATSYNIYYPESDRSKQLYNLALQGLKTVRQGAGESSRDTLQNIKELGYIEIELPDVQGKKHKLSSTQGKVVILDFTAYQAKYSPAYNINLAELYRKYHDQGLEIYQVSLDDDENFWKVSASNLPWICVHDDNSQQSQYAAVYNVTELPTFFILNRSGAIVSRDKSVKDLEAEIKALL